MNIHTDRTRRAILNRIKRARADVERAQRNLRDEEIARDEFELRHRPTYPTMEMRLALERAVHDVKVGHKPESHLGRAVGGGVSVHGQQGFISVNHGAPYGMAANGYLWQFTNAEVERIKDHLKAFGVTIVHDWGYAQGHSFTVKVAK